MSDDYSYLKKQYPKYISKEQFCKIAHISKRTAANLLNSGIVLCTISPKKTHTYLIAITDVISFLKQKESIEQAAGQHGRAKPKISSKIDIKQISRLSENDRRKFRKYISEEMKDFDDVMTVKDVCSFLGISPKRAEKWFREKTVFGFYYYKTILFPKTCLLDFFADEASFALLSSIPEYRALICGFLNAKNKGKT